MADIVLTIPTYRRRDRLERLLKTLAKNQEITQIAVQVSVDGPHDSEQYGYVEYVRSLFVTLPSLSHAEVIAQDTRLGVANHFETLVTQSFRRFSKIIFLEDDNLVSVHFLKFMISALNYYEHDPKVAYVSGYMYPTSIMKRQLNTNLPYVFTINAAAYGIALYREKYRTHAEMILNWKEYFLSNPLRYVQLRRHTNNIFPNLVRQEVLGARFFDVSASFDLFRSEKVAMQPTRTLVVNRGYGGDGENCGLNLDFQRQQYSDHAPEAAFRDSSRPTELRIALARIPSELFYMGLFLLLIANRRRGARRLLAFLDRLRST